MPIPESGCWIWMGPTNGKINWLAHGKMWFAGKVHYVHRVMYFLKTGSWPVHHVHHDCSVRLCCNPDHLTDISPIHNHLLGRGVETEFKKLEHYNVDPFELV